MVLGMAAPAQDDNSGKTAPAGDSIRYKHSILGVVISCVCLWFIAVQVDPANVWAVVSHFQWPYLLLGLLSLALGYAMRILRWCLLLRAGGAHVSAVACTGPFLGSISLNNILPMRMGDIVRVLVFPAAIGVRKTTATGSLVIERLIDVLTLLIGLAVGLAFSNLAQLPSWLEGTAVSLAVLGATTLALIFFFSEALARRCARFSGCAESRPRWVRLLSLLQDLLGSFTAMSRLPVLIVVFILSLLVWLGEAGLFWALLVGFGFNTGLEVAIVVMAITTLSTLVPSSPGYIGPFHLAAYTVMTMLGGTPEQSASFAVLSHLAVWLPTTLAGALAILFNPRMFGGLKRKLASN